MLGGSNGFLEADTEFIAAEIPSINTFPPEIQRSFEPLLQAQQKAREAGKKVEVLQPLVSIKNTLLEKSSSGSPANPVLK